MTGPLLLLGIAPRSGTNYVYNLLRSHSDLRCVTSPEIPEHFIVKYSPLLARYADTLAAAWGQYWRPAHLRDRGDLTFDERRAAILAGLGRGMLGVVAPDLDTDGRRVVTKTPSVDHLRNAFTLFPDGQVIVVVRDGRSVCHSAYTSAGDSYEVTMQRWARAARTILDVAADVAPERMLVVRYEDAVVDPHGSLRRIFDFAGADVERYDRGAVDGLPVLGSSEHYGTGGRQWQRVERDDSFDPLRRFADWAPDQLERFHWVAGAEASALGYDTSVERRRSDLSQRVRSIPWFLRATVKSSLTEGQRRLHRYDVFGRRPLPFDLD